MKISTADEKEGSNFKRNNNLRPKRNHMILIKMCVTETKKLERNHMILMIRACNRNKKTHKKTDKKTKQQIDTLFRKDANPTPTPRLKPRQTFVQLSPGGALPYIE